MNPSKLQTLRQFPKAMRWSQRGFTLAELVMVIVIIGVIGAVVAVFMKSPIDAYFASARRAALTDVADTALRSMTRSIRKALPNSVVDHNSNQCLELIPTKAGGRYRTGLGTDGKGDILDFTIQDTSFDMLGTNSSLSAQAIAVGDVIVVNNLGSSNVDTFGIPVADAYYQAGSQHNTSTVTVVKPGELPNETHITIEKTQFPLPSSSNRFNVVPAGENVLAFVCDGGKLWRTARKFTDAACPTTGGSILASNVSSCHFADFGSNSQNNGLVQLSIVFTDKDTGETISLHHEVHVNNSP